MRGGKVAGAQEVPYLGRLQPEEMVPSAGVEDAFWLLKYRIAFIILGCSYSEKALPHSLTACSNVIKASHDAVQAFHNFYNSLPQCNQSLS